MRRRLGTLACRKCRRSQCGKQRGQAGSISCMSRIREHTRLSYLGSNVLGRNHSPDGQSTLDDRSIRTVGGLIHRSSCRRHHSGKQLEVWRELARRTSKREQERCTCRRELGRRTCRRELGRRTCRRELGGMSCIRRTVWWRGRIRLRRQQLRQWR